MREWENNTSKDKVAPVTDIIHFFEARFKVVEAIGTRKNTVNRNIMTHSQSSSVVGNSDMGCYIYQFPHTLHKCPTLMALVAVERIKKVVDLKL